MKVARIYFRISADEQDLTRQEAIERETRDSGYYLAGIYREKASGARPDRPELLRMIADLQPDEVVVAGKIDRISRLPCRVWLIYLRWLTVSRRSSWIPSRSCC